MFARAVAGPWPSRGRWRRPGENRRAGLLERPLHRERQLRDIGQAAQSGELGGQLEVLGDEALILTLEQHADLL